LAKRNKSSAHAGTQRLSELEAKYRALEEDYRRVLHEVRSRTELFCRQREEIEKLTVITQK
jgi:molecular chaperone GrpE (heat shock protein)